MDQTQEQKLRCYMKDCGISRDDADTYIRLAECGSTEDQICLLKHQRNTVMERLHKASRQVDCIDFIIHELEQTKKEV